MTGGRDKKANYKQHSRENTCTTLPKISLNSYPKEKQEVIEERAADQERDLTEKEEERCEAIQEQVDCIQECIDNIECAMYSIESVG